MSLYSPQGWLFVHNRKTGGTTMRNLLHGPLVRYLTIPHERAWAVREYMKDIGAEGHWSLAFKFAFIRHPYNWVESMRRHAVAQEDHPLRAQALGEVSEWPYWLARACDRRMATTDGKLYFQRHMVFGPDGESLLDRLCRFENYADEVKWLLTHLGLPAPAELPNVGLHDIPETPITGEYRDQIAEHFHEDFNALQYDAT